MAAQAPWGMRPREGHYLCLPLPGVHTLTCTHMHACAHSHSHFHPGFPRLLSISELLGGQRGRRWSVPAPPPSQGAGSALAEHEVILRMRCV